MADSLTAKQKLFADEYIKCGNAEQAAVKAGYNARGNTTKLLQNTTIQEYIKECSTTIMTEKIAGMIEIKEFWTAMMYDANIPPIARLKASEYIAKTNGAFIDKIEHSGNTGVTIINDIPRNKTK